MRICLVTNAYPPLGDGGAELYVRSLATVLADEHHVVVVTMEPGAARLQPRREITSEGVVVYRLAPFFRAFDLYHPQVAMTVSDIIKHGRPDVVHVHNWKGLSLAAVLSSVPSSAPHIPVAMTLHDESLLSGRFLSNLNRRLVKRAGLVISPSRDLLDQHLQRGFFRQAMQQILPNGIEGNPPLQPSPSGKGQGGSLKPTFDILYIGRVDGSNGPYVIRAFRRLADPSLRLHVAGAGPALESCRSLANGDPRIRLYGFVEGAERVRLLSTADCVVLPSLWPENAPVTIQEAFQGGPVVIASRIGGIPEMVRDGVNGLLVEPGDESGIAAAIQRLRSSPELVAKLRASAAETARLYHMRFHVAHLVDAYQRLLATERIGPFDQRAA